MTKDSVKALSLRGRLCETKLEPKVDQKGKLSTKFKGHHFVYFKSS